MGNITSKTYAPENMTGTTWTYHAAKKHAVLTAGPESFSYDANGNAVTRNGNTVSWTAYNYASSLSSGLESASFAYGPDRSRWKMNYVNGGVTETTYYVGRVLEKVLSGGVSDYRHYIFAGGNPVAVYSRKSTGTNAITYSLDDHQGSIETLASPAGVLIANESFTAFGSRRSASTWTGSPTDRAILDGITRQGFTFQTALGSMGLNHMNGRVQDSVTGRFLSADPFTTHWYSSQAFNRYTYVRNNPMRFRDPTGFYDSQEDPEEEKDRDTADSGGGGGIETVIVNGQRGSGDGGASGGTGGNSGRHPPRPHDPAEADMNVVNSLLLEIEVLGRKAEEALRSGNSMMLRVFRSQIANRNSDLYKELYGVDMPPEIFYPFPEGDNAYDPPKGSDGNSPVPDYFSASLQI